MSFSVSAATAAAASTTANAAHRVMVCLDGSAACEPAFESALRVCQRRADSVLYLVRVVESLPRQPAGIAAAAHQYMHAIDEANRENVHAAEAYLVALRERVPAEIDTHLIVASDADAKQRVLELAAQLSIDTLVCGTRGRSAAANAVLGSFSQTMVNNATGFSVLVARA